MPPNIRRSRPKSPNDFTLFFRQPVIFNGDGFFVICPKDIEIHIKIISNVLQCFKGGSTFTCLPHGDGAFADPQCFGELCLEESVLESETLDIVCKCHDYHLRQ